MKIRTVVGSVVVGAGVLSAGVLAGAGVDAAPARAAAAAEPYTIDGVHSAVVYRITHMGVAPFYGRFNKFGGTFTWDESNPEAMSIDAKIDAESVDSNNANRDKHLKSPDFFNVKEHPEITFKSKSAKKVSDGVEVTGDLTMLGKTKEVTAKVVPVGAKTTERGSLAGFDMQIKIKRSEFGMNYGIENGAVSDVVELTVAVEGVKQS